MRGLAELISALVRSDIRFIVVGGMAAALQGAPVNTLDLDIVYARDTENVRRLLGVLKSVGAVFRDDPRRLEPTEGHHRGAPRGSVRRAATRRGAGSVSSLSKRIQRGRSR